MRSKIQSLDANHSLIMYKSEGWNHRTQFPLILSNPKGSIFPCYIMPLISKDKIHNNDIKTKILQITCNNYHNH
jgi:hypothetical protein